MTRPAPRGLRRRNRSAGADLLDRDGGGADDGAGVRRAGDRQSRRLGEAPAAFLVAAMLAVISAGDVAMSRRVTPASGCYTFVSHGFGRAAGLGALAEQLS